ncbi:hypothetical protein [Leuconostoc mesenteroides]|uniref:hypothetical protein n=1 Tax=Leuconostoc mesenteroides TaxID=1245 RepID=UPI0023607415|nr:hypothetical protein [Leuconostoc mesenteroides]
MTSIKQILARHDWENPVVTNWNRLPLHTSMSYANERDKREIKQPRKSLNGPCSEVNKLDYFYSVT